MKVVSTNLSVMVVDHDNNYRSILRGVLYSMGVRGVFDASDAATALEKCHQVSLDLAFVELNLPGINGLDFAKMLRTSEDSPAPTLPLVMTTSLGRLSTVKSAINAGFEGVLLKPLRPVDVHRKIEQVLSNPLTYIKSGSYYGPCRRRGMSRSYTGPRRRETDELQPPAMQPTEKEYRELEEPEIVSI